MAKNFLAHLVQTLRRQPANSPSAPLSIPKQTLEAGSVLNGRYRLDAELGRGGMGIVYRARDIRNDRDVAVKLINTETGGGRAREGLMREAQIMTQLHHPNIVAVHEIGTVDIVGNPPLPFIAMEFVRGYSLDQMRGLTIARITDLGIQICDALEYAHAQGLVHCDLKPQNVLVEKHGYRYAAKLADFGLARERNVSGAVEESSVAGSVYYIAPEVIAGKPPDIAADLYALGAMLYEAVTGRVPFSNYDTDAILSQHLTEPVIPPSQSRAGLPPGLEAIIVRLLAKEPKDRFARAREVRQALEQVAQVSGPRAHAGNLPQEAYKLSGHEKQAGRVQELLESSRCVTLVGDNVTERSRLALAVGAQLTEQLADGAWWVDLAPISDPALVPQAVAAALNVQAEAHRALTVSLADNLREKSLLLMLDRCDAVQGACAQFAESILRTCPDVCILATSRQALGIAGEAVLQASRPAE